MQSLTPKTLAELAQALSAATEKAKIIAGGTDFIIKERAGKFAPDLLIYPGFIPELNTVTKENGVLRIGAAVPMNGITAALKDDKAFCAIADAASDVGSPQIRAKGTMAGNLCPKHCYLNSNTSSLLMSDIYKDVSDERKAMTFSVDHDDPIRNSYLEMMWNPSTSEETKKAAIAHYHTLGFEPVITEREIKGYSINRVWRAVKRECLYLWANGYVTDVAEFDRGWMTEWHSNIGPFKLMDLIGLQTIYNIENSYYAASGDERDKPPANAHVR